jgi:WD40 repeat protein
LADFGLAPSPQLADMERRVLGQDPALAPVSGPAMLAAALRTSTVMIGRDAQRRSLTTAWRVAKTGSGQLRILAGPLEAGRTRIAIDLAARALAEGGAVEYVRGADMLAALGGSGTPDQPFGRVVDQIAERCRSKPLVLIVDDVEWATSEAIELIRAVAAAVDQLALLLVLVMDQAAGGPAVTAIDRLDPTGVSTIDVGAMPDDELAGVIAAAGVDEGAIGGIVAVSNGLPGLAKREAAAWAERTASERLRMAATSSLGANALAQRAQASVLDEVIELVAARARRDELWSARWAGRQPYRALATYGPQDAEVFVGRERLVAELAARVLERRFVVVVGSSGSGKSSLVRAGLIPLARSGRLPGVGPWSTHVIVPGSDPLGALDVIEDLDEPGSRLLVVDQFEEAFAAPAATLERFAGQLVDLAGDPGLDVHVVVVVRSDEYSKLASIPALTEVVATSQLLVGSPNDEEFRRIVAEPARRTGATVEPALVDLVARDVGGYDAALPLVSSTLAELWERREGGVLRAERYLELGGLATVVERLGDHALAAAGDQHVGAVRQILLMLADVTDDGVWTRRRVLAGELPSDDRALDALVSSRLVVRSDDTVEIIHEVVFRAWPQLAAWLDEARSDLILERELRATARNWHSDGRPEDNLFRGTRLQAALEWAERSTEPIVPVVTEFLVAGRQLAERRDHEIRQQLHHERRARQRVTWALGAAGILLVVALVAGALASVAQRRASREERAAAHRALVSNSTALRANQRELAALLAIEAHRLAPSAATESALFGTFTSARGLERTVRAEGGLDDTAILLDAETMVLSEPNGLVHVVDLATGAEKYELTLLESDNGFAVSAATPDGRYLATAWHDFNNERGAFSVWDLETRQKRFVNVDTDWPIGSVALSPDGSTVVIGGGPDARAVIYDASSGARRAEVDPIPRPADARFVVNTVAFAWAPNGELIVGSQAGPIRHIDPATGKEVRRIDGPRETSETTVRVSPDGHSLVTAGWRGHMRYDLESGDALWSRPTELEGCSDGFAYAERIGVLLCGEKSQRVRAIDLATGAVTTPQFNQQSGNVCALLDTPDGTLLVHVTCGKGDYGLWHFDGGGAVSRLVAPAADRQFVFEYTADGHTLLAEHDEGQDEFVTELINPSSGVAETLPGIYAPIPTGDPSRVFASFEDDTFGAYDLVTRRPAGRSVDLQYNRFGSVVSGDSALVWGAEVNEDGEPFRGRLTAVDPGGRVIFDVNSTEANSIGAAAYPDSAHLVSVDCSFVCLLQRRDPTTGAPIGEPVGKDRGFSAVVGGSSVLVAVEFDGQVVMLDPEKLSPLGGPLPAVGGGVIALSLSDDARRLLVLGADQSLRLYDLPSRTQLGDAIPVGVEFGGAALRPDGLEAAVTTDQGIVMWDLDPEHWITGPCGIAARNLTRAEWDQYIGDLVSYRPTCPQYETPE